MQGFFPRSELQVVTSNVLVPECGRCGLFRKCHSPKMPVTGHGKRGILIVGEAPGKDEDRLNKQFVGVTGQELRRTLLKFDINPDRDCWFTNALICRPSGTNEIHDAKAVSYCRPNLIRTIKELRPSTVLVLGSTALASILGWLWTKPESVIGKWAGYQVPSQQINAWVCPTFHPSYVLRADQENKRVVRLIWEQHLEKALALKGRPWGKVPDWKSEVEVIKDPGLAADHIRAYSDGPIAFDFETNMLKPDGNDSFIWSCSVSDGVTTVSYPWQGEAIGATEKLLRGPLPKLGHNIKFEERWARAKLGFGVRNWMWDGAIGAHVIDNKSGVSNLEFQAFVLLGQPPYKSLAKDFLKSKDRCGYAPNRIKEIPIQDLLLYGGQDAVLEYHVCRKQMEVLGFDPEGKG